MLSEVRFDRKSRKATKTQDFRARHLGYNCRSRFQSIRDRMAKMKKKSFEQFYDPPGLGLKHRDHEVNALFYVMGEHAEDIFSTFQLTEGEAKTFNVAPMSLDAYLILRRSVYF